MTLSGASVPPRRRQPAFAVLGQANAGLAESETIPEPAGDLLVHLVEPLAVVGEGRCSAAPPRRGRGGPSRTSRGRPGTGGRRRRCRPRRAGAPLLPARRCTDLPKRRSACRVPPRAPPPGRGRQVPGYDRRGRARRRWRWACIHSRWDRCRDRRRGRSSAAWRLRTCRHATATGSPCPPAPARRRSSRRRRRCCRRRDSPPSGSGSRR